MFYEAEFIFLKTLLENLYLNFTILDAPANGIPDTLPVFDLGLRGLIYNEKDYTRFLTPALQRLNTSNTIFRIQDEYMCSYICLQLPDIQEHLPYLLIGPYVNRRLTPQTLLKFAEELNLSPKQFMQINKYYSDLPFLTDGETLFAITTAFGKTIWGSTENFSVEYIENMLSERVVPATSDSNFQEPEEAFLSMQILEKRYASENHLIHMVSQGLIHNAEAALSNNNFIRLEQRLADPVRNIKNYCIILNTLLRKGAEQGNVHPLHIDNLSSKFAREIEQITSPQGGQALQKEMVHKYCLLVKNHSMKGFSLLVQKVLTRIDSDLTADLTLKTQARFLNVNASYLSTLFKKEMGMTLTDYVNKKRIEHAVFLLNSTSMQIQNIAQYCGIPDVNYFTRILKKYMEKAPTEYRQELAQENQWR